MGKSGLNADFNSTLATIFQSNLLVVFIFCCCCCCCCFYVVFFLSLSFSLFHFFSLVYDCFHKFAFFPPGYRHNHMTMAAIARFSRSGWTHFFPENPFGLKWHYKTVIGLRRSGGGGRFMCECVRAFATVYTFLPENIDLANKWKCTRKCETGVGFFYINNKVDIYFQTHHSTPSRPASPPPAPPPPPRVSFEDQMNSLHTSMTTNNSLP